MALGSTALHLWIAKFKFTHNFIICDQLPETELIFGIDIQKKFSLSYAWDKDKNCYIQQNGKFLVYTHANTRTATIGTVKSTLKIPHRHSGVVPIKISGPIITTHMAYFLTDDSIPKGKDPNINIIDGIHKIKGRTSVNILVFNYTINTSHLTKANILDILNQWSWIQQTIRIHIKQIAWHWRKWCLKPLHPTPLIHHDMTSLDLYRITLNCYYKSTSHNLPKMKQQ